MTWFNKNNIQGELNDMRLDGGIAYILKNMKYKL